MSNIYHNKYNLVHTHLVQSLYEPGVSLECCLHHYLVLVVYLEERMYIQFGVLHRDEEKV